MFGHFCTISYKMYESNDVLAIPHAVSTKDIVYPHLLEVASNTEFEIPYTTNPTSAPYTTAFFLVFGTCTPSADTISIPDIISDDINLKLLTLSVLFLYIVFLVTKYHNSVNII